jgi:predicted ATPase
VLLLDRDHELERLEAVLDELPAGGSPALVVEGDPGIGKTRLLAELAERARSRGGAALSGRAAEYET